MRDIRFLLFALVYFSMVSCSPEAINYQTQTVEILRDSILILAKNNLNEPIITVTTDTAERSTGGIHDYFSEGDYWWPDPDNPDGPYIRKDGMTNPDNFTAHRAALMRLSEIVGNLTSAYLITKDPIYCKAAINHCKAWFIEDETKMNPHFLYAQAIQGRHTGRGIGIIDGIHFMEVVQSLTVFEQEGLIDDQTMQAFRAWFSDFVTWLTTHKYGQDEMVHPNNHGTCWNMQVGLYAVFTKNDRILNFCRENFKKTLLPNQMGTDGSFPLELERTKPYGYSLFNLDAMVMNGVILSDEENNLWAFTTPDGKSLLLGLEFLKPFVEDKSNWFKEPDVMYWDDWPVAHPAYWAGSLAYNRPDFFEVWAPHEHFPEVFEVKRNLPIRNPLIWGKAIEIAQ